ncbi:MAG: ATP-binding protein, partial [Candidatus Methanomethylophilaceae archaeon]|nr:ATP-binding protein [Candidatus Methanomethylophilaceae archaeon]
MKRKIITKMKGWKDDSDHKPQVLIGCRQIGKTYSVREFGRDNYSDVIYINFEEMPEQRAIFSGNLDYRTIIDRIETVNKKSLRKGKSLIILDEIQSCNAAYSSLKSLSQQHDVDVIALGSFLGLRIDGDDSRISPLGYVNLLEMHPMDFEEFLWAMGYDEELIGSVSGKIRALENIDPVINRALSDAFRRYVVVGGMPEAVRTYSATGSYMKAYEKLQDIVEILKRDAGKYSGNADRMKIIRCLESIPNQLARKNKKFTYASIEKRRGRGSRYYGSALDWLRNAGLIEYCYNVTEPNPPLSGKVCNDDFKIYLCDTGLMSVLIEDADIDAMVNRDPYANNGAFMENAVASALIRLGYDLRFYEKENSTLEIDFLINTDGIINLIEVKSGRNKKSKSLSTLLTEKDRKRAGIKIAEGNIYIDEKGVIHLPLYGACFIKESTVAEIGPLDP